MSGRLQEIDWKAIVEAGEPFKDPHFPHGKYCLFMNHQYPKKDNLESKQKWIHDFHWKRASEYFEGVDYQIFDGVDPSDVIMGSCNDCYAFAALAGIAEGLGEEADLDEKSKGLRIRDNFLTQTVNSAGCYAINFIIDGQLRTIVIDDYFPFTYSKAGKEIFAFAKCKHGENEIWVQLVEKAWAKLCGSYESAEMGRCNEFFSNFDGSPTDTYWTDDYETGQGEEELYRILSMADKNNYVMTGSVLKSMKK